MTQSNNRPLELSNLSKEISEELQCAIRSDARILISGDDRHGKGDIAHLIHRLGPRGKGPFVVVDCSARDSAIGELLGEHGLVEQASSGTAFVDKIGEMSADLQAELIRFLDIETNVRMIVGSNENLYEDVLAGRFREDLYYRLNIIHIVLTDSSIAPDLSSRIHQGLSVSERIPFEKAV